MLRCYRMAHQLLHRDRKSPRLTREQLAKLSEPGALRRRSGRTTLLVVCLVLLTSSLAAAAESFIRTQPEKLLNGAPFLVRVRTPYKVSALTGTWLGHQLTFSFDARSNTWFALAGTSIETQPGSYPLELSGERMPQISSNQRWILSRNLTVGTAKYPEIKVELQVEKKFTEPTPEQQQQIAEGVKIKQDYLSRVTPEREWSGDFAAPAQASISDVFGSQRIFNGVAQSPHLGLDFRVPTGTPVAAMNDGTVLLARNLYFEGGFVVLDHGQGLLTLYLHLSEFKVKEGDAVKRGQIIALSGGTGRATGPHLHVAVRWQGTYLDPGRLIQLQLPKGN